MSVSREGGLSASCGIKLGGTEQLFLHYRIMIQLLGMGLKDKINVIVHRWCYKLETGDMRAKSSWYNLSKQAQCNLKMLLSSA